VPSGDERVPTLKPNHLRLLVFPSFFGFRANFGLRVFRNLFSLMISPIWIPIP
jgi:hypothetical protein